MSGDLAGGLAAAGEWVVERIGDDPVAQGPGPRLAFTRGGRVAGHTGINRFSGGYRLEGDRMRVGPLLMTRVGGPRALMEQEHRFAAALDAVEGAALEGQVLTLTGPVPLTLRAAAPAPA